MIGYYHVHCYGTKNYNSHCTHDALEVNYIHIVCMHHLTLYTYKVWMWYQHDYVFYYICDYSCVGTTCSSTTASLATRSRCTMSCLVYYRNLHTPQHGGHLVNQSKCLESDSNSTHTHKHDICDRLCIIINHPFAAFCQKWSWMSAKQDFVNRLVLRLLVANLWTRIYLRVAAIDHKKRAFNKIPYDISVNIVSWPLYTHAQEDTQLNMEDKLR